MRILFVHNSLRTFVRLDRDILASEHTVQELDLSVPARLASLPEGLANTDLIYCWFAGLHSFFPAILGLAVGKPIVCEVGAYDAANVPEIGFGHMGHPWKRHVVRAVCQAATLLICHSRYAEETVRRNVRVETPIRMIHLGVEFPAQAINAEREPLALSVGQVRQVNLQRKGHEVFARASKLVPEASFLLVGKIMDGSGAHLESIGAESFQLRDHVAQDELDNLYRRASVYVQPSVHESFGMTVVESMGAGDIPVVSSRGSLPEVVGSHGIFVDERDPASVAEGIRKGLESTLDQRQCVAEYVRTAFPLERRRTALLEAIDGTARQRRRHFPFAGSA